MKKTLKWSLMMMLAVVGLTFASCSDDDDDTPTVGTVEDVIGDYAGKMTYTMSKAEETPGTTLELKVENDSINFDKFPFETLVKAIITDEDAANKIIAEVEKVQYKVGYKAEMNTAKDSVFLTLDPKPLAIALSENVAVNVTITAANGGSYAVKEKSLKFNLTATEAKMGETNMLPAPIALSFDMKKK